MRFLFPIASLCLAGSLWAQTDSVAHRDLTDSVINPADSLRPPRTISVRWLPMEVHRFTSKQLDSSVALSTISASGNTSRPDTSTRLSFAGSKTVKVGVGGNGGVALDQTLFLTAEGELSPGVKIRARLSDGDLPLSAQGSSASLREIDEVFIDVQSPTWGGRLGDQEWRLPGGLAPGFERRTRGVAANWRSGPDTILAMFGGAQAKWKRVSFTGQEGRQEGYPLAGWQGGIHGVVVPGSERVKVNGQLLKKGADADYQVRYADGLLDFSTHRRILSSDAIEVEFQSAELAYERSFAASRTVGAKGLLGWQAWAARETDDALRPLAYAPDSSSRRILGETGSNDSAINPSTGQILTLPAQVGEAGIRLRLGDTTAWIAMDLRGSDFDPNTMSSLDARKSGYFATAASGWSVGRHVGRGGSGRLTTTLRAQRLDARFHGLSSTDTLGGSGSGIWNPSKSVERNLSEGRWSWELLPGIGIRTDLAGLDQPEGWTTRSSSTMGVDFSPNRQLLTTWEWIRFDDGSEPLIQTRSQSRFSWPTGRFVPSVEIGSDTRDRHNGDSLGNQAALSLVAGTLWRPLPSEFELGLFGNTRRDAIRASPIQELLDTSRSIGTNSRIKWSPLLGDLELEADWKSTRIRQIPSLPWVESRNWLGSANAGFWPWPGFRGQGRWKLSSSSFQPEIPRYDTVPVGTGTYRFDTLLRIVVPSDEGDLRPSGTRLDTSRAAVLASQRTLSGEMEFEPRRVFPKLHGVLADVGVRFHTEFEESDSSRNNRIVPHFDDEGLSQAINGRSNFGGGLWWAIERKRLEASWERTYVVQASPFPSRTRDISQRLQWSSATKSGHRFECTGAHGNLRDVSDDRSLREEDYWSTDPSLAIRIHPAVELIPGWYSKWSTGSASGTLFDASIQAPHGSLRATLPRGLGLLGDIRRVQAEVPPLAGSRLSEGYPDGATWRASAGLDWAWKDHVQARADWLARKEPRRPWFQKLSLEAKAIF